MISPLQLVFVNIHSQFDLIWNHTCMIKIQSNIIYKILKGVRKILFLTLLTHYTMNFHVTFFFFKITRKGAKVKKTKEMDGFFKIFAKYSLQSLYFSNYKYWIPLIFEIKKKRSNLVQNLIFLVFLVPGLKKRKKIVGFQWQREKIIIDTDFNHQNDGYWCQQVPYGERSFTQIFFFIFKLPKKYI